MFIGLAKTQYQRRSEERNSSRVWSLKNHSAPPNGAGGLLSSIYKHVTAHGVKPIKWFRTNDVEIRRFGRDSAFRPNLAHFSLPCCSLAQLPRK